MSNKVGVVIPDVEEKDRETFTHLCQSVHGCQPSVLFGFMVNHYQGLINQLQIGLKDRDAGKTIPHEQVFSELLGEKGDGN